MLIEVKVYKKVLQTKHFVDICGLPLKSMGKSLNCNVPGQIRAKLSTGKYKETFTRKNM